MTTSWRIITGDCIEVTRTMADCSVDAVVTDPPYGLAFMGKRWDYDVPSVEVWAECLRVLKPGGHLLAFAGTRTQHRMAVRIEDAGFEIRDMIAWVYGSGFPKSLDVSKAIDKAAGAEREVVGDKLDKPGYHLSPGGGNKFGSGSGLHGHRDDARLRAAIITAPATDAAKQWSGWGTALKPAMEPITVARKPLIGTVAENVLAHGTGAINVDGCRIGTDMVGWSGGAAGGNTWNDQNCGLRKTGEARPVVGRWPANLIHDGSDEVVGLFPQTTSNIPTNTVATRRTPSAAVHESGKGRVGATMPRSGFDDSGSAARFFYCAKASKRDRDAGCEGLEARNHHPTVKPTDLMRYLCRLVTPPGGIVLDPFMGSGSTGKAATIEGFRFIGIEREAEYCEIARRRMFKAK